MTPQDRIRMEIIFCLIFILDTSNTFFVNCNSAGHPFNGKVFLIDTSKKFFFFFFYKFRKLKKTKLLLV